jgi:predicted nucleic acid-binding protein
VSRFVLDNTIAMSWCFPDEATKFTEALLDRLSNLTDSAIVPALWLYEVVNVIELAVRHGLPLAALDEALAKAARQAGVPLLQA